jgi:hypothetical protein
MKGTTFNTCNNYNSNHFPSRFFGTDFNSIVPFWWATFHLANQDIPFNSTNPKIHGPWAKNRINDQINSVHTQPLFYTPAASLKSERKFKRRKSNRYSNHEWIWLIFKEETSKDLPTSESTSTITWNFWNFVHRKGRGNISRTNRAKRGWWHKG